MRLIFHKLILVRLDTQLSFRENVWDCYMQISIGKVPFLPPITDAEVNVIKT